MGILTLCSKNVKIAKAGKLIIFTFATFLANSLMKVETKIRHNKAIVLDGYQSVNECLGPYTQVDYTQLEFDFTRAIMNINWSLALILVNLLLQNCLIYSKVLKNNVEKTLPEKKET